MDTTTIEHIDNNELLNKCAIILRRNGWVVVEGDKMKMETPREIRRRFNLKPSVLHYRINSFNGKFPCTRSESGRLLRVCVTPELEAHLKYEPNNQGKKFSGISIDLGACGDANR